MSTTMQQEAVLRKALMAAYYGEERAEALEEEAVSGEGPRGLPSPTMSEASATPGVEELQKILMETYDPTKETVDSFVARVDIARLIAFRDLDLRRLRSGFRKSAQGPKLLKKSLP